MDDDEPEVLNEAPAPAGEATPPGVGDPAGDDSGERPAEAIGAGATGAGEEPAGDPGAATAEATTDLRDEPVAVAEDECAPIEPGSLRMGPDAGRELFGALFAGLTAFGPAQFGSHNEMHNYLGAKPVDPIISPLPGIGDLLAVYAPAAADRELDDLLEQRPTVCLAGPRNSGRYSTARAALARRYGTDRIYEIALPAERSPHVLVEKPERLPDGCGFILRLSGDDHLETMRILADLFRRRNASLLLIKDDEPGRGHRHGAMVRHCPPDLTDVFQKHLAVRLPAPERGLIDRYVTEEVRDELKATYGPKESVALAEAIAEARPGDEQILRGILERSQPRRRERAAVILLPGRNDAGVRGRRSSQHERAFRVSYAVFYRRPLHYVFEAADWLLREIDSAALRPEWGSMALQHAVHDLLGEGLMQDWTDGREPGRAGPGFTRSAWMRDEGLRGAIIDVAWHEFDGTRRSLLHWLDRLVLDGDSTMRRAAAETAGLLVHYDFEQVHEALVDMWAASPRPDVRQAAAWTMTLSDMADDIGPKIRAKLSQWCSGAKNYQRDTAARVYASGLEQPVLSWSMLDLARVAGDRLQRRRHVVAEAVNQLYRPERAEWLLTELNNWSCAAPLQVHAARALLALAARTEQEAADGRPDLLQRLAKGDIGARHLGRLWLVAFCEADTAAAAAAGLGRWIRYAQAHPDGRPLVRALLDEIGTAPARWRRVRFYLKQSAGFTNGLPEWTSEESRRTP
jgi:hypothetical protein